MTKAAKVLGVSRQHMHRLLAEPKAKGPAVAEEVAAPGRGDDRVQVVLDLPRRCVQWLELEALKRNRFRHQGARLMRPNIHARSRECRLVR